MEIRNAPLIRHPAERVRSTHLEVFDNNNLGKGEEEESAKANEEVPPQIVDI